MIIKNMAKNPVFKEESEELIIGKITDLTSAFIRLIISFLKFIKLDVPGTAENAIGIILLLLFIYTSGGILILDLSVPMVILYLIIVIFILEIIAHNSSRISRIMSGRSSTENRIKRITEGSITPNEASLEIERHEFDADDIDKLVKELSINNNFTINIQRSLINSQKIYAKNLKTYFGKDTNVELDDEIVIDILDNRTIDNALAEDEIRTIFKKYGENDEIVAKLILHQRLANRILIKEISHSAKLEYEAQKEYIEKPYWLDKHLSIVSKLIIIIPSAIFICVILYLYYIYFNTYFRNHIVIASIINSFLLIPILLFSTPLFIFIYKIDGIISSHVKNQKILVLQKLKEKISMNETERNASQVQRNA